ncbi:hypothetical protein FALCPG4_010143 [Fusarium falciforme]
MLLSQVPAFLGAAFVAAVGAEVLPAAPGTVVITDHLTSMHQLSSDPEFAFILGEFLSFSNRGGANTGEILRLLP